MRRPIESFWRSKGWRRISVDETGRNLSGEFREKHNSEFGKVRPALIIQNDIANRVIDKVAFKGVTLPPLTSRISGGSLRVTLKARDHLHQESEICINELYTLDLSRIDLSRCLTTLTPDELEEVERKLCHHLGVGFF